VSAASVAKALFILDLVVGEEEKKRRRRRREEVPTVHFWHFQGKSF